MTTTCQWSPVNSTLLQLTAPKFSPIYYANALSLLLHPPIIITIFLLLCMQLTDNMIEIMFSPKRQKT